MAEDSLTLLSVKIRPFTLSLSECVWEWIGPGRNEAMSAQQAPRPTKPVAPSFCWDLELSTVWERMDCPTTTLLDKLYREALRLPRMGGSSVTPRLLDFTHRMPSTRLRRWVSRPQTQQLNTSRRSLPESCGENHPAWSCFISCPVKILDTIVLR